MLFSSPQPPASPTLFPYTTLFRSVGAATADELLGRTPGTDWGTWTPGHPAAAAEVVGASGVGDELRDALADVGVTVDRKSTRLNSSHLVISYAVFCLKKKNQHS